MLPCPWSARAVARRLTLGACAGSLLVAGLPALSAPAAAAPTTLYLSEYVEGSSSNKAVEIANPTGSPVDLNGWDLQVFSNGSATAGRSIALQGTVAPGEVHVLVDDAAGSALKGRADQTASTGLWNGDDALVLRQAGQVRDSLGQVGVDPGTEWGTGLTSTADNTLRRRAGAGPDTTTGDAFDPAVEYAGFATDSFDGLGVAGEGAAPPPPPPPPPAGTTRISAVQGSGATSPLAGSTVTVEGVVTSLISQGDALAGVFVQEQDDEADQDPATSEGLYVVCGTSCPADLAAGDLVRATGAVAESFTSTQLTATAVERTGTAAVPAAAAVPLPAAASTRDAATFERFEGMRTTIPTTLAVSEYFNLARFGELVLTAGGRPFQYTEDNAPSAAGYTAFLQDLNTRRITLDDASNDQNDPVSGDPDEAYAYLGNGFRGGDTITGLTGVMEFSFGAWKLRPVPGASYAFTSANPRPEAPPAVGGELRVASFNVLNYFATVDTTLSNEDGTCGPSGTADCRGADSEAERQRQLAKTVAALRAIDADVVGLIEIQNDEGQATQQIVDALNAATAPGTYDHVRTGVIGTDAIKQAFLYKPAAVEAVGAFQTLTAADDPRFVDTRNRPALIQTFRERATGEVVTVAVNHFKSKGSGCGEGDDSPADGSGNCDATRVAAAQALVDHLATDPTGSGDPDVLVIGDLNSYSQERPITTLTGAGYVDLLERDEDGDGYGYVFDGQLGHLDHALASAPLAGQVTRAAGWRINADEPVVYDYNDDVRDPGEAAFERETTVGALYAADPYRSSDHDPVLVGLDLQGPVDPTVQLLHFSDFHGHLAQSATEGAARLAGVVEQLRAQVPSTALVSSGDSIGASPFISSVAQDEPTLDVLNAMDVAVSAVGNHEFDRGYRDLADRVVPRVEFPYLGANVEGELPDLPGSSVQTLPNGVTVGYVGVVTEQTASLVSPGGIPGITFSDPVAAANREAELLSDGDPANGEADVVVLLAHEGAATAASSPESCAAVAAAQDAFGEIVRGVADTVDAVLGGHTHVRLDCELRRADGSVLPVLMSGEYGQALSRLTFRYDEATDRITDVAGTVLPMTQALYPGVSDPEVAAIVAEAQAQARELGSPVVGRITADITRALRPDGSDDRGRESVLGNFIADVQLEAVEKTGTPVDVAFMNPGGLREDFLVSDQYDDEAPGEVTVGEAGVVQPFANTLFTLRLTGAQLDEVLEQQYQPAGASRPFLALGVSEGLFFLTDDTAPVGQRISGVTLDGQPLVADRLYTVVTNSFLASGGDNFRTLGQGLERTDTGLDDLTVLLQHFRDNSPITADTAPRRARLQDQPVETAPVADAGGPYEGRAGKDVLLDASGSSDADGDVLAFAWDLDGDGAFDDATGPQVRYGKGQRPGRYEVSVQVSDGTSTDVDAAVVDVVTPGRGTPPGRG